MCLCCCGLQCALKLLLSPLMLLGAALIGVGVWIKVDPDFWTLQLNLDAKQFTSASSVIIVVGAVILIIGFLGCCGASKENSCLLITFFGVMFVLVILEIAALVIVWSAVHDKEFNEKVQETISRGIRQREDKPEMAYFMDVLQTKLQCCGVRNSDEYPSPPRSCTNEKTGRSYEKGCMDVLIEYLKSKATIIVSIIIAALVLQIGVMISAICLVCGIRQAKKQIF